MTSENERDYETFGPAVCALIEKTIDRMRQHGIGYPTLDEYTRDVKDFISLFSSKLVNKYFLQENLKNTYCSNADHSAVYLDFLRSPRAFCGDEPRDRHSTALTFWAFVRAVQDLSTTSGQYGLNEVARNTGLFGHLASTLRIYKELENVEDLEGGEGLVYWVDFPSRHLEPDLGADFAIVIGLGNDRYKVAFLQAKRVRYNSDAKIDHYVEKHECGQIDILVDVENNKPLTSDPENLTIFGRWCFYVFWHEVIGDGDLVLPTVRSAHAVKKTRHGQRSSSLTDGVEFAAFVTLFLADAEANVGYLVEGNDMATLFNGHKPMALLLLDPPANGPSPQEKSELLRELGYTLASPLSGHIQRRPDPDSDVPGMGGP